MQLNRWEWMHVAYAYFVGEKDREKRILWFMVTLHNYAEL